jgi:general secretion pathway protein G
VPSLDPDSAPRAARPAAQFTATRSASGIASDDGHRCRRRRGFTLLELLVVIVIIGMLAGLVAPRYFDQVSKSNTKIAKAQIDSLEKALDQYRLDVGSYPTTEQGLDALNTRPQNLEKWTGPYLKKAVPLDPWSVSYVYKSPGDHGEYDLMSYGKDGQPGGTGEAADVTSW